MYHRCMGVMKQFDIRIRSGGDDAIFAVGELLAELERRLVELQTSLPRWISVDERLPDAGEPVLACWSLQKTGMGCAMLRDLAGKLCWTPVDQWQECDQPIAWMPLPEPPAS